VYGLGVWLGGAILLRARRLGVWLARGP
jgi:hypothetical protein